eukprot:SAG22_NODE_1246_length_5017_cov_20.060175_1_plen_41_part_00
MLKIDSVCKIANFLSIDRRNMGKVDFHESNYLEYTRLKNT